MTTNTTNEKIDENEFFKTPSGHTKYNEKCKNCKHSCKQSYRAILVSCSSYEPKPHNAKPAIDNPPAETATAVEEAKPIESEAIEPKELKEVEEVKPKKAPAKPKKAKKSEGTDTPSASKSPAGREEAKKTKSSTKN